jgi:hypothetical protein
MNELDPNTALQMKAADYFLSELNDQLQFICSL